MTLLRALGLGIGLLSGGVAAASAASDPMMAATPKILAPLDGTTVSRPVVVRFDAGAPEADQMAMSGDTMMGHRHVHLLIDADVPRPGATVPVDVHHRHFMNGETTANLSLAPGRHTLRLLIANGQHVVDDPPVASEPVTITVK